MSAQDRYVIVITISDKLVAIVSFSEYVIMCSRDLSVDIFGSPVSAVVADKLGKHLYSPKDANLLHEFITSTDNMDTVCAVRTKYVLRLVAMRYL